MELMLFRPAEFKQFYLDGCAGFNIDDTPLSARQDLTTAHVDIALCTVYYILYVPCLAGMWRLRALTCYKLLLYICAVDCLQMWIIGFLRAYYYIVGAVYCQSPVFMYFIGHLAFSLSLSENVAQLVISFNRCLVIIAPKLEARLFDGQRFWGWLLVPFAYGALYFLWGKALPFSGALNGFCFDPFIGQPNDQPAYYYSVWYAYVNQAVITCILLPAIYIVFTVAFFAKLRKYLNGGFSSLSAGQKMVFVQVLFMSVLQISNSALANYQYLFNSFAGIVQTMLVYNWLNICGSPSLVLLVTNRSIRVEAKQALLTLLKKLQAQLESPQTNGVFPILPTVASSTRVVNLQRTTGPNGPPQRQQNNNGFVAGMEAHNGNNRAGAMATVNA